MLAVFDSEKRGIVVRDDPKGGKEGEKQHYKMFDESIPMHWSASGKCDVTMQA
jgi:hypothetical protein